MSNSAPLSQLGDTHVARYSALVPASAVSDPTIPQEIRDVIAARKILMAVSSSAPTPGIASGAVTNQDFAMSFAVCPPGTGPGLHKHHATVETFVCLRGCFRLQWGPAGEHHVDLVPFDVFVVPAGVDRAFTNISNEEGVIQVIITGGIHDRQDISFPAATRDVLVKHGPQHLARYESMGFHFEGDDKKSGS